VIPHVFVLLDDMLCKMDGVFANLSVDRERMKRNIESAGGLIMAEPVMMKMTEKGIGRQDAHEIVRSASMIAVKDGRQLLDVLLRDTRVTDRMTEKELRRTMDPANYTGGAGEITDEMVRAAEKATGKKVI
jgi:adenylosuccinate lyase